MTLKKTLFGCSLILLVTMMSFCAKPAPKKQRDTTRILAYEVNPKTEKLQFYWKNDEGEVYSNFQNLKTQLQAKQQELVFAMNGGMYQKDQSPQGLYIENGKLKSPLETKAAGFGNFYLQPNGVFYITQENNPVICVTTAFKNAENIKYATQSGPMLVIDGKLHEKLTKGSENLHIRNGVGVLPNGNLLFAMSKEKINFYDFATFFKENGCKNALYLDGFVSKTYLPSKNYQQLDGNFGVIIGVVKSAH
ncbi:phosphodiester glycosidase family protein [Kordia sp. YSTF-M3]|uniref:Phosphodiester glycosidase family protein n=1 Tax=Kordia aestuariivivens TaxID=2759037 RepID=A0ABR7QGB7_9FLAO|nr:phosphodiester glycosidase family protein [Kordia aestuariivivens]MBC8757533.1 phosphodiester glycosidase family protein [Kordia aestuariivivens]